MAQHSTNPLVVDIARRLLTDGRFDMRLETGEYQTGHLQAVVDVGWAARKAGRLLGQPVRVTTSRADEPGAPLVVTAILVEG
jgi:hypothetical protein